MAEETIVYQTLLSMNDFCTYRPLLCKLYNSRFLCSRYLKTKTLPIDFKQIKFKRPVGLSENNRNTLSLHYFGYIYNSYLASSRFLLQ